jgi:hypothetical protein
MIKIKQKQADGVITLTNQTTFHDMQQQHPPDKEDDCY